MRFISVLLVIALVSGCQSFGGGILPGNENSQIADNEFVCLQPVVAIDEAAMAPLLLAPLVKSAAGFLIDKAAGAIEQESKLYQATYSARLPEKLLYYQKRSDQMPDGKVITTESHKSRLKGFKFARFAGDSKLSECPANFSKDAEMSFEADLEIEEGNVLHIKPRQFTFNRSKAKVPAWGQIVDVNVQVTISALAADKDGKKGLVEVARVDFPMGKTAVGKGTVRDEKWLRQFAAGWYPLPGFAAPSAPGPYGPIVVMVTVMEANDLGDVLAKGAKSLRDDKEKLVDKLLKELDLKD